MGIWQFIGDACESKGAALNSLFEWTRSLFGSDPAVRRQVAFSIAMIALSAKMAQADGVVTVDEERAFRSIFQVADGEERNVTRLFNIAKRDVAGFESYAAKIKSLYADDLEGLADVIDGLFAIARADGAVHEAEMVYLERVAAIFGINGPAFEKIAARHVIGPEGDPYPILGATRGMGLGEIRPLYIKLVAENHPDRLMARGLPAEAIAIATERLAAINRAWERIEQELSPAGAAG